MGESGEANLVGVLDPLEASDVKPPQNSTPLPDTDSLQSPQFQGEPRRDIFIEDREKRDAGQVSDEERDLRNLIAGEKNTVAEKDISVIMEMIDLAGIKAESLPKEIQEELVALEVQQMEPQEFARRAKALFPKIKEELSKKGELEEMGEKNLNKWQEMIETEAVNPENLMRVLRGRSTQLSPTVQTEAANLMGDLEKENQKPEKTKDWKTIREKSFKLGKIFGIGTLIMFIMTIWKAFRSLGSGGASHGSAG